MPGNFTEQNYLQYCSKEDLHAYVGVEGRWNEEKKRAIFTHRSRSLEDYSDFFINKGIDPTRVMEGFDGIQTNGLYFLFNRVLEAKGSVNWIDLGCGNAIAQRQAKKLFKSVGIDPSRMITIGYDALPFDDFEYRYRKSQFQNQRGSTFRQHYGEDDLDPLFEPTLLIEDISKARFPIEPDIVTCHQVLQWTTNPLEIFANAATQMSEGSILSITGLNSMVFQRNGGNSRANEIPLIKKVYAGNSRLPGFDFIYQSHTVDIPRRVEILRRSNEIIVDFTYGYIHAYSTHPKDMYTWTNETEYVNYYQSNG